MMGVPNARFSLPSMTPGAPRADEGNDLLGAQLLQGLRRKGPDSTLIGSRDIRHLQERQGGRPALSSHDQASGLHDEGDAALAKEHEDSLEPPLDVDGAAAA